MVCSITGDSFQNVAACGGDTPQWKHVQMGIIYKKSVKMYMVAAGRSSIDRYGRRRVVWGS
jgi:hypothetical protein